MNKHLRDILISILRSAFDLPADSVKIDANDIKELEIIAFNQKILPIITAGLKALGYSDLISENMKIDDAKCIYDYTQRKVFLDEISLALESESIQYVPLKGSVIRDLYPEPWMRTSSDIDVLIHYQDLDKAIRTIESKTSFKYTKIEQYDAHFINKYVHLELHYNLECDVEKIDKSLKEAWKNTTQIPDSYKHLFTPEFNMFYIVSHSAKHFIHSGGIGIRPLLDLYVLRTKTIFDERKVLEYCDSSGILGFYAMCCKLINIWFNMDDYDEYSQIFEDLVFSSGVFGSKHLKIVSNKQRDSGKAYILRRLFKKSDEIRNFYPICRKYPVLIPLFQVVRWNKVAKARRTKEIISEFKQANIINQSEVEKYDRLMKAMGL